MRKIKKISSIFSILVVCALGIYGFRQNEISENDKNIANLVDLIEKNKIDFNYYDKNHFDKFDETIYLNTVMNNTCFGSEKIEYATRIGEFFNDYNEGLVNCRNLNNSLSQDIQIFGHSSIIDGKDFQFYEDYKKLIFENKGLSRDQLTLDAKDLFYKMFPLILDESIRKERSFMVKFALADLALFANSSELFMVGPILFLELIQEKSIDQNFRASIIKRLKEHIFYEFSGSSGSDLPDSWKKIIYICEKKYNLYKGNMNES